MNPDVSKYFWILDHNISDYYINNYIEALKTKNILQLSEIVSVIKNKIPILPQAYITPNITKCIDAKLPADFLDELSILLSYFEETTGHSFGGTQDALLLSIEGDFSGSVRTIGASLKSFDSMIQLYGTYKAMEIFVDCYESFSTSVLNAGTISFREMFNISYDRDKGIDGLQKIDKNDFELKIKQFIEAVSLKVGKVFPDAPEKMLLSTLLHFAKAKKENKNDEIFLRVVIPSSTEGRYINGMTYTSDPFTGLKDMYATLRLYTDGDHYGKDKIKEKLAIIYTFLEEHLDTVEQIFKDIMGVTFVSDFNDRVYFSSFYKASKTPVAEIFSAIDLYSKGLIKDAEAMSRIKSDDVEILLHPMLKESSRDKLVNLGYRGITAAPGTVVGKAFFKIKDAISYCESNVEKKYKAILFTQELLISDSQGLSILGGLVTKVSGIASHAAVMARANGIPCIVGYKDMFINVDAACMTIGERKIEQGTVITLEASNEGFLYLGEGDLQLPSIENGILKDIAELINKITLRQDVVLPIDVKANINSARDAEIAIAFGADGVGLCRTENMLTSTEALKELRKIIFCEDESLHEDSLKKLEQIQFNDFKNIFNVIKDRPINIRLMDMPLDDFSPKTEANFEALSSELFMLSKEQLMKKSKELKEHNPMLGLRACRWGIINPKVYDIQLKAIIKAAYEVAKSGIQVKPGIMFPLVFSHNELNIMSNMLTEIHDQICLEKEISYKDKIHVRLGCMLELPSATLSTDKLAELCEFFAFGTNDLTQTTLGISRDDSGVFLPYYIDKGIIDVDPFVCLSEPVKELIEIATRRGRKTRSNAVFGICGEQGGEASTLKFCLEQGINYLSCSSYRILPLRVALLNMVLKNLPS